MPAITFRSVVLPAPLWPIKPTRSPFSMRSETDCSVLIRRDVPRRRNRTNADRKVSFFMASTRNSRSTFCRMIRANSEDEDDAAAVVRDDGGRRGGEHREDDESGGVGLRRRGRRGHERPAHDFDQVVERVVVNGPAKPAVFQQL